MCAISGCVGLPIEETCMHAMLQTMARRGPDGRGIYRNADCTLLHTRLAIIDPTGGAQPMELLWGGEHYCITYNGELYNTEQLRSTLEKLGHAFATHSDTEVVLHSYAQWGPECLLKMNGIFAFGIWEGRKRRMFLARDRIGVKPLFYSLSGEGLLFASEIKTILVHPSQRAALDAEGAAQILLLGPGRQPGSGVFCGIRELEPGCWATFEGGTLAVHRYWSLKDREHRENFRQTAEHTRALVLDAITRQMVSDVPIGTFLSGGLDSSLISAVCAEKMEQAGRQLMTFSVGYPENDKYFRAGKFQPTSDSDFIGLMEEFLHSDHHLTELPPETLVSILSLTRMRPRSFFSPAASRFRLAVLALRPMATSTFSASKLTVSPALVLQTTFAPTGDSSTACTGHSRWKSMPIFFMWATPIVVKSPSSMGSM